MYIIAIDQGTSSTRVLAINHLGEIIAAHQIELTIISPHPAWTELEPNLIFETVECCIDKVCEKLNQLHPDVSITNLIRCVGITNQRESTIAWNKCTNQPLHNAIIWNDVRTHEICEKLIHNCNGNKNQFVEICGLPISSYFSATKMKWLLENCENVKQAAIDQSLLLGTVDSWILWNLIGKHLTDVTNASRTMLMNLKTLQWDDNLCNTFNISKVFLANIQSSSSNFGLIQKGPLKGIPITSCLGDQQASLVGQRCFQVGQAKNTYGTGCFMLFNIGNEIKFSTHGLLTTVAYKFGDDQPVYALEGAIASAGSGIRWLRDNLQIITKPAEAEIFARTVEDSGEVVFVPAFSGLFAPYWREDARGLIIGLSQFSTKAHICRAMLESVAFQSAELIEAMEKDANIKLTELKVDGGMTVCKLLLQIQSDLLGITVVRPENSEITALGAAFAAGLTIGFWTKEQIEQINLKIENYQSKSTEIERMNKMRIWKKAVERSFNWIE
eukprot:TRINITY_DN367_c3_g1_i2.p1 TRINITY_DN367_c3_g1~~TRINITY_DN367_c3_g1_i2.p1  ORF type:complete len:500 (-),score=236.03 TRINITY_DN367_c3_g1_i2:192-1691(-)